MSGLYLHRSRPTGHCSLRSPRNYDGRCLPLDLFRLFTGPRSVSANVRAYFMLTLVLLEFITSHRISSGRVAKLSVNNGRSEVCSVSCVYGSLAKCSFCTVSSVTLPHFSVIEWAWLNDTEAGAFIFSVIFVTFSFRDFSFLILSQFRLKLLLDLVLFICNSQAIRHEFAQ